MLESKTWIIQSRGELVIYINSISDNNIQTHNMGKDGIISQLVLSLYIESDKIDYINEGFTQKSRGLTMMKHHLTMWRVNHLINF